MMRWILITAGARVMRGTRDVVTQSTHRTISQRIGGHDVEADRVFSSDSLLTAKAGSRVAVLTTLADISRHLTAARPFALAGVRSRVYIGISTD